MVTMKLFLTAFVAILGVGWLHGRPTYIDEPCGAYVCLRARRTPMNAQEIWDGGKGKLKVVQAQERFEDLIPGSLQEGDIVAFRGVHVAVFHQGRFVDSDPRHDGPGPMQYVEGDSWFLGPVRILRWRDAGKVR
jgi:hypothetical protein